MGTGYVRNDVTNNIADGNVINAADFDGEFDAIEAAFNSSTGHTHDGTSAEGAPITVVGPAQEWLVDGTALYPKLDDTYDIGKVGAEIRNIFIDGTANIDSLVADTADINGGTMDGVVIGGATPAAVTATTVNGTTVTASVGFVGGLTGNVTGNLTGNVTGDLTGNASTATALATSRSFSITGDVTASVVGFNGTGDVVLNASIDPDLVTIAGLAKTTGNFIVGNGSDWTVESGATARASLGLGSMATQNLSAVNIDGGTIDGTVIGGGTAAAGTFTSIQASSTVTLIGTGLAFQRPDDPNTHEITRLTREANSFNIKTRDSASNLVSTDYEMTIGASGATEHSFLIAGTERLHIDSTGIDVSGGITCDGIGVTSGNDCSPLANNSSDLGNLVTRWRTLYLVNAPNVSSDARLKENIADLTDAERRAAAKIKARTFNMIEGGQKKVGYIAQEVIEAMASEGLDAFEYGLVSDGETYGVDMDAINAFRLG